MRHYTELYFRPDQLSDEYKAQLWKFLSIQISVEGGLSGGSGVDQPSSRMILLPVPEARYRTIIETKLGDEANHAYGLFQLAKSIGYDPHQFMTDIRRNPERDRKLDVFKQDFTYSSHLANEIRSMLTEAAGGVASISAMGSTYLPWAMWNARNFMDEGLGHSVRSMMIVKDYVESGHRSDAQELLDATYPHAVDLFGKAGSDNEQRYLELGIKTMNNTQCRVIWMRMVRDRIRQAGLRFPEDPYAGARGRYDECRDGLETNWGAGRFGLSTGERSADEGHPVSSLAAMEGH